MMALSGGCFETYTHQMYNYCQGQGYQQINLGEETFINDSGPASSNLLTGSKERRDSTDSDKENAFESFIQFPDCSNDPQKEDHSQVCKEKIFFNEESASNSARNLRESQTEENLECLLKNLFHDDNNGAAKKLESSISPPHPEEIGLSSIPESSDFVEFENSPFQYLDHLEFQNQLDGELSLSREMELDVGPVDVFLGYETSSLDEDIKRALEFPASEDIDFLRDISVGVNMGVLQEDIHQVLVHPGDQIEESLSNQEESQAVPVATNKTEEEEEDWPGVRTRLGRKRKPGTVVDLLVSSYCRKRTTRCRDCGPCRAPDCGVCVFCLDKPKFGGRNKKRGACLQRKCLNMSLAHTKVTPAQSVESEEGSLGESGEEQEVASETSTGNESVETIMNDEDVDAVKHDHCYSLNGETNKIALKGIDLLCYESLDEFMAETLEVPLEKQQGDPIIGNILSEPHQEVLEISYDSSLTVTPTEMVLEEDEATRKFFQVGLKQLPPVYSKDEDSKQDSMKKEDKKAFKRELSRINPNPKVKRRRRNFKI